MPLLSSFFVSTMLTYPATAHEDVDGSYDRLPLAYQGQVAAFVTDKLRDPQAAQFRNLRLLRTASGDSMVCGEVNARNGYGGYNGFEPFAIISHKGERFSRFVPSLFLPEMRPALRRAVAKVGC